MIHKKLHLLVFFLDGVGMGSDHRDQNPFVSARLPRTTDLLGERWYLHPDAGGSGKVEGSRASLVPTDPILGIPGRPQSATGQATILTGENVPQKIGEHYGPKPNGAVSSIVEASNLFCEVLEAGGTAALLTPYPPSYFEAVDSGRRLLSSVPLAAVSAGLKLMTADDLREGRAVSPGFTGQGWHDYFGYTDIPIYTLYDSGKMIASLARNHNFSFFEHWPSDRSGHRGTLSEAVQHLETIDQVLGGLFDSWNEDEDLLLITSDHGNIEEKDHRQHSLNPVPTILFGRDHKVYARMISDLTSIAKVARAFLGLNSR